MWDPCFRLEQESGFFFNMKYFEEKVIGGEWDEVEKYLSGFTKVDDNRYSMKIFFEIRKQKYLEALDKYGDLPSCFFICYIISFPGFGCLLTGPARQGQSQVESGVDTCGPLVQKNFKNILLFMPFSKKFIKIYLKLQKL